MRHLTLTAAAIALLLTAATFAESTPADSTPKEENKPVPAVLNFTMKDINGKDVPLSRYQGKVILMVNTASKCGLTPQYKELQALYEKYKDQGFVILGFPANNFGRQEPGSNEEIAEFCEKNYGVTFDMFSKVSVKDEDKCALYQFLTSEQTNPKFPGEITWNFEKFLIDRNGELVARFAPKTKPSDESVVKTIEAKLTEKPAA